METMTAPALAKALLLLVVSALLSTTPASAYHVRRRSLLQEQAAKDSPHLDSVVSALPPETSQALSHYLSNADLVARLHEISRQRCSHLGARVYEIGRSVRGQPLVVMSIGHEGIRGGAAALVAEKENEMEQIEGSNSSSSSNLRNARGLLRDAADPEKHPSPYSVSSARPRRRHRAHVKYVAGLHGDEPSGRQLLVALAEYICAFDPKLAAAELVARRGSSGGGAGGAAAATAAATAGISSSSSSSPQRPGRHSDPRVAALLSRTVLHLAPAVNPDGFDLRRRENAAGVDLNRDFPDPLELHANVPVGKLFGGGGGGNDSSSAPFVGSLPCRSPDPDADDVDLSPRGKEQPETLALMRWMTPEATRNGGGGGGGGEGRRQRTSFRFVASAALHEGALVANYPWDGTPDGSTRYAACPDDATFRWMASSYATRSPAMVSGPEFGKGVARPTDDGLVVPEGGGGGGVSSSVSSSSVSSSASFSSGSSSSNVPDAGTTNGAAWYPLRGGMQDWNYLQASCFELTLELAQNKWPQPSLLPLMFAENLDPLLAFPVVASAGAHGVVLGGEGDGKGSKGEETTTTTKTPTSSPLPPPPPAGTTIRVRGLRGAPPALPDPLTGAWFRPLNPGNYVLSVAAPGLQPVEAEIVVGGGGGNGREGGSTKRRPVALILDRSPYLEVTLREQGSTARLVEVSSVVTAAASGAAVVSVPLAKAKTTTKAGAAAAAADDLLRGRKAGPASSSSSFSSSSKKTLSGDGAAVFGLQVALAVAALVAVARRAAGAGRKGGGAAFAVTAGSSSSSSAA